MKTAQKEVPLRESAHKAEVRQRKKHKVTLAAKISFAVTIAVAITIFTKLIALW